MELPMYFALPPVLPVGIAGATPNTPFLFPRPLLELDEHIGILPVQRKRRKRNHHARQGVNPCRLTVDNKSELRGPHRDTARHRSYRHVAKLPVGSRYGRRCTTRARYLPFLGQRPSRRTTAPSPIALGKISCSSRKSLANEIMPSTRAKRRELSLLPGADKGAHRAVICALGFRRKEAAGDFAAASVVSHTLTAEAFSFAGFVGTGTAGKVFILLALHRETPSTFLYTFSRTPPKTLQREEKPRLPWYLYLGVERTNFPHLGRKSPHA